MKNIRSVVAGFLFLLFVFWSTTNVSGQNRCGLGAVWDEYEIGGWHGTWTRRSMSNTFDAVYKLGGQTDVASVLNIAILGSDIAAERVDLPGGVQNLNCSYRGKFSSDGVSVSGTYFCVALDGTKTPTYQWRATIGCDGGPVSTSFLGRWRGTYRNSKGESGYSNLSFSQGADGKLSGTEDGAALTELSITGNAVWFRYKLSGCRSVEGRLTIGVDGKTAGGSYAVVECNGVDRYTGSYIDYTKQQ